MRGHTTAVILELLKEYHRVEEVFQGGYEKGVQILRKRHSEDMVKVAEDIFAHYYISGRNTLAIKLIVSVPIIDLVIILPSGDVIFKKAFYLFLCRYRTITLQQKPVCLSVCLSVCVLTHSILFLHSLYLGSVDVTGNLSFI